MSKDSLIASLISSNYLKTPSIIKAFQKVDRADFVLPEYRGAAHQDHPLPIGFGQTISQPATVAMMLEWLEPKKGQKILDIGCGSGWTTALLSSIVGKKGKVIGIERISELAEMAKKNLIKYPAFHRTSTVMQEDGSKGYLKEASYDRILASAAGKDIPEAWKEQLKIGGRIVAPVEDSVVIVDRLSRDKFKTTKHWGFAFVPLVTDK